jgi:AcrR family transcriptional regulator
MLARLLEATIDTLEEYGVAGATIPRIAETAKAAPASVYRRFRDKEALLRAAVIHVLERSSTATAATVPPLLKGRTLEWVAGVLARSLLAQYRTRPALMRALIRFVETDNDVAFKEQAMALIAGNARLVVDTIVEEFRDEIAHPDPHRAVTFATLALANIAESRALEELSLWHTMLPSSDEELCIELQRLFLGYVSKP